MTSWYHREGNTVIMALHVQPAAKFTEIAGPHGDALKIRLAAPPIDGRANEALLRFIAELFKVPLRNIELLRGAQSRRKILQVTGSDIAPESLFGPDVP